MTSIDTYPIPLAGSDLLLDETEQLIWSLLDDELPEVGVVELENILREQPNLCRLYVKCAQLHFDLVDAFGNAGEASMNTSPPLRIYSEEQC